MTITSTVTTFDTTGATASTSYTFNYPIHKASHLKIYVAGVKKETNDGTYPYTVTVATNKASATVAFTTASSVNGLALKFERIVEYTQETDLANNSLFDAESLETSLDNIVMQTQQAGLSADSSFGFDPGLPDTSVGFHSTRRAAATLNRDKTTRALKALAFDANGDITISTDNIDAQIAAVAGSASAAAGSAGAAAGSALAASNDLATFQGIFRGSSTSTPGTPTDGDLWFDTNTNINLMKVYNASASPAAWEQLTPTTTHQTNINTVVASPLAANIGLVAAIDDKVTDVAAIDDKVEDVAAIDTEITTLINGTDGISNTGGTTKNILLVNGVHGKLTEVGNLGTSTVLGHMAALNATNVIAHMAALNASNVITNIGLVAAVDGETADVAAINTEITTLINGTDGVSGTGGSVKNILLVNSVHGKITEVGNLGTSTVVGHMTALNASGVIANMAALNASGVIADIGDVADVDAEITLLGTPAMAHATTGNLVKLTATGVIGDIETVADSIADVNRYANEYKIQTTAPGSPSEGDIWMDTSSNHVFKVHNGTSFVTVTEGQTAAEVTAEATAQAISMSIALG